MRRRFALFILCAAGCTEPKAPTTEPGSQRPTATPTIASTGSVATTAAPTSSGKQVKPPAPRDFTTANFAVEENVPALPQGTFTKGKAVALKAKWSANVGRLTFKSTMIAVDGKIVVGTHGKSLSGLGEASDGVYVLKGATGAVEKQIVVPGKGDLDVGGVAMDGDTIFFTTDAGSVIAAKTDGTQVWSTSVGNKIRPAPALARTRSKDELEVVVGDETGKLSVLDAKSGAMLWSMETGENDYRGRGFVASPAIVDVDEDGRDDIIAGARDGVLVAYRGTDGKPFWRATGQSGIHGSPSIIDVDGDGKLEVIGAWSYSTVAVFDVARGKQNWAASLERPGGGVEGLFSSPVPVPGQTRGSGFIAIGSSWWGKEDGITLVSGKRATRQQDGRTTSSAVVADLNDDGTVEAIFVTEAGAIVSFDTRLERTELGRVGAGAEATPMIADVDQNGTFELLVVGGDGVLRCFETGSKTPPLVSRFRGESPHNRGDLTNLLL